ncbi:UNVERIFIED_CONTAM: DnaJsubfamily B member 4 [Sesamum calycinum]|uniref:DnaJsubfamily B member 4 n=1 Tax=Sesamum calycinum TaxID=2727403 RepID=A0AAW2PRA6_9LAMI
MNSGGGLRKAPPVENVLMCSLEELYNGATRKMKISRSVLDSHGVQLIFCHLAVSYVENGFLKLVVDNVLLTIRRFSTGDIMLDSCTTYDRSLAPVGQSVAMFSVVLRLSSLDKFSIFLVATNKMFHLRFLNINIDDCIQPYPGWKKGTKVTFPEKGNEPGIVPADLIFVVDEKTHPVYRRDGNDLIAKQEVTLLESLTGKTLELSALDGRNITVPLTEVMKPGHEVLVPNEGMPYSKDPRKKGTLRIQIDVRYPKRLTEAQKHELRRILGGSL